jgi:hypothetical protein
MSIREYKKKERLKDKTNIKNNLINDAYKYTFLKYVLFIIIIFSLYDILYSPINRYFLTKKLYKDARNIANQKNKKLMVIGDPCTGNYFESISKLFPNCEHGDITIDLYGCSKCDKFDINDLERWKKFNDNEYVIIETAVFSYANDMTLLLHELKRITGGDLLSAGSTNGFFWENGIYKSYDSNLKNIVYPFDFRKDKYYKYKKLSGKSKKINIITF